MTTANTAPGMGHGDAEKAHTALPQIVIRCVEDEMVTLHHLGSYKETLFMSCPEQANDFQKRYSLHRIYSLDAWYVLKEEFQKDWKSKYTDDE